MTYTDADITLVTSGKTYTVRFNDLLGVFIETTDKGPAIDDMFFILAHRDASLRVPSEALGATALLRRLQQLPDFDSQAVIEAAGSTNNAIFQCWDRGDR